MPPTPPSDLLEQVFDLISPYLPSSILTPLHSVLSLPTKLYQDPSQLIPLIISLLALYAAVQSLFSTTRLALRATWFLLKWGAILLALGGTWASWNGYNIGGDRGTLGTAAEWGKSAFSVGRQGVNWWTNTGVAGTSAKANSNSGRKSASGRARTWAKATEDGGWDDPSERDLGKENSNDPLKFVQDAVLTFLGTGTSGESNAKGKAKTKGKGKAKAEEPGWASKFAMNQAKQAWDGVADGVRDALSGEEAKGTKGKKNR